MIYDLSFVVMVTITVTCYSWAPSSGDHLFTCGVISRSPQGLVDIEWQISGLNLKIATKSEVFVPMAPPR